MQQKRCKSDLPSDYVDSKIYFIIIYAERLSLGLQCLNIPSMELRRLHLDINIK